MSVYKCVAIFSRRCYHRAHLCLFVFFDCSLLEGQGQAVLSGECGVMNYHTALCQGEGEV